METGAGKAHIKLAHVAICHLMNKLFRNMGIIYFTGLNETKYDQNLALSSARLFLKIILENITIFLEKTLQFPAAVAGALTHKMTGAARV